MKKLILFPLTILLFLACQNEQFNPEAKFIRMSSEEVTLGLSSVEVGVSCESIVDEDVHIGFTAQGSAKEGKDFELSAHEFVIPKGKKEGKITVTRLNPTNLPEKKINFLINLDDIKRDCYRVSIYKYTKVNLSSKTADIVNFAQSQMNMNYYANVLLRATKANGAKFNFHKDLDFEFELDSGTTAKEGEHFEIVGGSKKISIPKSKDSGELKIKFIKLEKGKDKIVLKLKAKSNFGLGLNNKLNIDIKGPFNLVGKWKFDALQNKDYIKSKSSSSDIEEFDKEDSFEISGNDFKSYTFKPNFKSILKDYFSSSEQMMTFEDEITISERNTETNFSEYQASKYKMKDMNVNFSSTQQERRESYVSFNISDSGEYLDIFIQDITPKEKFKSLFDNVKSFDKLPIHLRFKK